MLNVKVCDSTNRKRLNKYGFFERWLGEKSLFNLKGTFAAFLSTAKFHMNKPMWRCCAIFHSVTFGENQTQHIGTNTPHQLSSTVVEGVMILVCFPATGPGYLALIESTVNSSVYQSTLNSKVRASVQQLQLGLNWVNDTVLIPSTAANPRQNDWKRKEARCWPSQSPDKPDAKAVAWP